MLKQYSLHGIMQIQIYNLGIKSLKNECAIYKKRGFDYLYLGQADHYKTKIDGFEILGPRTGADNNECLHSLRRCKRRYRCTNFCGKHEAFPR